MQPELRQVPGVFHVSCYLLVITQIKQDCWVRYISLAFLNEEVEHYGI